MRQTVVKAIRRMAESSWGRVSLEAGAVAVSLTIRPELAWRNRRPMRLRTSCWVRRDLSAPLDTDREGFDAADEIRTQSLDRASDIDTAPARRQLFEEHSNLEAS